MKAFVVDASVVLVYLLHEKVLVANQVARLLKKAERNETAVCSSSLFPLEVANGLRFSIKDEQYTQEILGDFQTLPIEIIPLSDTQVRKALEMAYELKMTVYDASYHVLAIARNATYITADREYYEKAKEIGNIKLI